MSEARVLPTDWSTSTSSSDHSNITNYANALTNVDSTTYGYWFSSSSGYTYIKFDLNDLPSNVGPTSFRIKAVCSTTASSMPRAYSTVVYNGETYDSGVVTLTTTTTTYTLSLPSGISPVMLKNADAIYITLRIPLANQINVYGAEMDIDTTSYKIFNLILPRG